MIKTIPMMAPLLLIAVPLRAAEPPTPTPTAVPLTREAWGAARVDVKQTAGRWQIDGRRVKVALNAKDLAIDITHGAAKWSMVPSGKEDMVVRSKGTTATVRLADAPQIAIVKYDAGYKTGVKLTLTGWPQAPELKLYLTVALEGQDEELAFDVAADEGASVIRRLDWPTALDGREIDHTVLSNYRGVLLPRTWDKPYHPIRTQRAADRPPDTSEVQSDVVECWSMSWWGFQKGPAAMMVLVETSDDAAYQFDHPAGGPTVIGPRWRAQLGQLGYPRSLRLIFFDKGNYVTLAKRYRRHAMETGLWVSLKEKIARSPKVEQLIGSIESRMGILTNIVPESLRYNKEDPGRNHRLTSFDERAKQMRELKAKGIDRFQLVLTGWHYLGYDRQHPDGLPPAPPAGGYEGMKRLAETCRELGYLFTPHDQYRDYYFDAPSFDPQFAAHEEEEGGQTTIFPGTRFGAWKEGRLSVHPNWDGGKQTYLGPRFMVGHMKKNYGELIARGIQADGSYLDVFGYVPPDEDFHPEHPTTRTEAKREIARLYQWARQNLGIVGTEAGVDWTVPYTDYSSPLGAGRGGIAVPLFNLVYHDAVMVPYSPGGGREDVSTPPRPTPAGAAATPTATPTPAAPPRPNWLYGMLNGGPPRAGFNQIDSQRNVLDQMTRLHKRVALLEMTSHEFLDGGFEKERTTFSDGTTVTVDWKAQTVVVAP